MFRTSDHLLPAIAVDQLSADHLRRRCARVTHDARRILVHDRGHLHSTGTHDELLRADGLYAHLARLRFMHDDAPA